MKIQLSELWFMQEGGLHLLSIIVTSFPYAVQRNYDVVSFFSLCCNLVRWLIRYIKLIFPKSCCVFLEQLSSIHIPLIPFNQKDRNVIICGSSKKW